MGRPREGADHLADLARFKKRRQSDMTVSGIIVHQREIARAMIDQRMGKLGRIAGFAEAADQDDSTVLDHGDGVVQGFDDFIYHSVVIADTA